ncbi:cytokinin riboside 5'-monophosphate phosphoribohydrolase [Bacteroidia bacterium]|nr:cytokinin riboside 5'-monophosphate phosphoribohydrolase [Bacteroidia bacterium]
MNVCVFCASSNELAGIFYAESESLGRAIALKGWRLVYGGTQEGLMEAAAKGALKAGGQVKGVIPQCIVDMGLANREITELQVVADMKERKALLRESADAFVVLPGGWGTMDEVAEVITLKHLGMHNKPVIFVNTDGFYDPFFKFLTTAKEQHFIAQEYESLYKVVRTAEEAIYIDGRLRTASKPSNT